MSGLPAEARDSRSCSCGLGRSRSDRKSTRLNSSHSQISYAVFCLKKKKKTNDLDGFVSHPFSAFVRRIMVFVVSRTHHLFPLTRLCIAHRCRTLLVPLLY